MAKKDNKSKVETVVKIASAVVTVGGAILDVLGKKTGK